MSAACKKPFKRKRFSKPQQMKTKFRSSARWTKFRKKLKAMQVLDPVTGAELDSKYTVHHLDMDELNYCNLDHPENFICLIVPIIFLSSSKNALTFPNIFLRFWQWAR